MATFRGLAECAILRNEATVCGHRAMDREVSGVAAGSRARKRAVASWTRWREAALVWAFDTGRSHTRLAYGALRALGGNPDARAVHSLWLLISGFLGAYLCVRSKVAAEWVDSLADSRAGRVDVDVGCFYMIAGIGVDRFRLDGRFLLVIGDRGCRRLRA